MLNAKHFIKVQSWPQALCSLSRLNSDSRGSSLSKNLRTWSGSYNCGIWNLTFFFPRSMHKRENQSRLSWLYLLSKMLLSSDNKNNLCINRLFQGTLLSCTLRTFIRSIAVWPVNEYMSKQKFLMQLMFCSHLNSYLGVYKGKAYILILLRWALQWKPGMFHQMIITNSCLSLQNFSPKYVVLSLCFLLWTYSFVQESLWTWPFRLPFQDSTWGKLQVNSVLWYNLSVIHVDSLSNVKQWTAALIIWLRGLMSSNAVCWYQIDYKEQKRFGGWVS